MAMEASGIRVDDHGAWLDLGRTFGARRLKILLFLSQYPELDSADWSGKVELHLGGKSVKGAVHRAPVEVGSY